MAAGSTITAPAPGGRLPPGRTKGATLPVGYLLAKHSSICCSWPSGIPLPLRSGVATGPSARPKTGNIQRPQVGLRRIENLRKGHRGGSAVGALVEIVQREVRVPVRRAEKPHTGHHRIPRQLGRRHVVLDAIHEVRKDPVALLDVRRRVAVEHADPQEFPRVPHLREGHRVVAVEIGEAELGVRGALRCMDLPGVAEQDVRLMGFRTAVRRPEGLDARLVPEARDVAEIVERPSRSTAAGGSPRNPRRRSRSDGDRAG